MIKSFLINNSMNLVKNNNNYNKEQLEEIKYGLESIYLLLTKFVVIITISIILGIFKETLILLLFYNFLRAFAFGIHASKSIYCWISSSIIFLGIPLICKNFIFQNLFFIIGTIICFLCIAIFAPADTEKRPLINIKKRKVYKFLSIFVTIIYIISIFITKNVLLKNLMMFSLIIQTVLILPITYKMFKLPYNNYKNYK
ncbi:MAG: accessory gene regulator B family protein [Bacilli bacterium]|nr:accessory gene regulator B family protein [Bacilli bacterium]